CSRLSTHTATRCIAYCYADQRDLHSFPTRRSSDLAQLVGLIAVIHGEIRPLPVAQHAQALEFASLVVDLLIGIGACLGLDLGHRSEEHTSELQSRENLVCRLLLEKKKGTRS